MANDNIKRYAPDPDLTGSAMPAKQVVDHLFRHESGRIISVLTKIFGLSNIEIAEDIVQDVLLKALEQWKLKGIPDNPSAWIMKAAKNKTLDFLRHKKLEERYASRITPLLRSEYTLNYTLNNYFSETGIQDDQLRMMFVCCHPSLNEQAQIALILKTLCGFSTAEIASAFITNEALIAKRIYRAKEKLKTENIRFEMPDDISVSERLHIVLRSLYLLFNEGYSASNNDNLIREDLAGEAFRLCYLLSRHKLTDLPETHALLALMCFHGARFTGRTDAEGNILLLREQNRELWDHTLINEGIAELEAAASGDVISIYHLEAAIAFEHCAAPNYDDTNWTTILAHYDQLLSLTASPVTALNRAIVVAEIKGAEAALPLIEHLKIHADLQHYYLLFAVEADLLMRCGKYLPAKQSFEKAIALTSSDREKILLQKKLDNCMANMHNPATISVNNSL